MPCFSEIALYDERDNGIEPDLNIEGTFAAAMPSVAPREASLFEPVRDRYGWRLALVFGNHARAGAVLTFRARVSIATSVPARGRPSITPPTASDSIGSATTIAAQLDSISHLVLYNSGSILNPREMPPDLLDEILGFARSLAARSDCLGRFA